MRIVIDHRVLQGVRTVPTTNTSMKDFFPVLLLFSWILLNCSSSTSQVESGFELVCIPIRRTALKTKQVTVAFSSHRQRLATCKWLEKLESEPKIKPKDIDEVSRTT